MINKGSRVLGEGVLFLLILGFVTGAFAFDHGYSHYGKVLEQFVTLKGPSSTVNYTALRKSPRDLEAFIKAVETLTPEEFQAFSPDEQLAFLINAYNGLTLKLIVMEKPKTSIQDLKTWFKSPWKKEFFTLFGKPHHLDFIEHENIRKIFKEPRIHFAVNCASVGCPPLGNKPYLPNTLTKQLELATQSFINDKTRNRLEKNTLYLSKIFKWYAEDFENASGSIQAFIGKYLPKVPPHAKIKYLDYDWHLNGQ